MYMSFPSNLILENNHNLISREQNYVLDRKLLTVHSEDRDISKWLYSNEFEIACPQTYTNIQSMRLAEINLPCIYYNFSLYLQNSKFQFDFSGSTFDVTLDDGYYQSTDLENAMANAMNNKVELTYPGVTGFVVKYDAIKEKMIIANNVGTFSLNFGVKLSYDESIACVQQQHGVDYYNRYNKWGFPAYLGYIDKKTYVATEVTDVSGLYLSYESTPAVDWITSDASNNVWKSESPNVIDILGEMSIYMELDRYNNYDELIPWPDTSANTMCGSKSKNCGGFGELKYVAVRGSGTNSAFAKIPIIDIPKTQIFDSRNAFLTNIVQYDPPIERITKFKFRFRYHDGRLVDFQRNALNFTLEINQLKNEIGKKMNIRVPAAYII
jgi:hypothetical protein